jgi:putative sigma-54 modulation protein
MKVDVKIHSVHFDADKKLLNFIEERVNKLTKFYDHIIDAEVILKIEKGATPENKVAEIRLSIPGNDAFSKKISKSFEESVDLAIEALRRQIKKHKEKERSL